MGTGNNAYGAGNGPARLSSLKSAGTSKSGLKFKPKAAARRTKEEREATAPKLKSEEEPRLPSDRKKSYNKRTNNASNQNRRMARYLNNTHVVSTGPLAAGNFSSDRGEGPKRTFMRLGDQGGAVPPLVLQGLQKMQEEDENSDDDANGEEEDEEMEKKPSLNRFNMGKEYCLHDLNGSEEEEEAEGTPDMDEEAWRALKTEELFPIRPVRYRHQDLEVLQNADKDTSSNNTTREPTPAPKEASVKQEPTDNSDDMQSQLHKKLDELSLTHEFQSLDSSEIAAELKSINEDHEHIWKTFRKNNNKPNRFILFQLPPQLPEFEKIPIRKEPSEPSGENGNDESENKDKDAGTDHPSPLEGRIGTIRVHKSGKLSAKIGNVVMDITRGTEATFLQDAVALNQNSEELPFAELLGRVDGRVVITPRF